MGDRAVFFLVRGENWTLWSEQDLAWFSPPPCYSVSHWRKVWGELAGFPNRAVAMIPVIQEALSTDWRQNQKNLLLLRTWCNKLSCEQTLRNYGSRRVLQYWLMQKWISVLFLPAPHLCLHLWNKGSAYCYFFLGNALKPTSKCCRNARHYIFPVTNCFS